ncbi:hypothetical protein BD289DRAFT_287448 [Coniella lustricola]|uniref:Uncharacterized protein n=1 Tax=Coniella lustricola TaxID=2025994 RepID=A0A2T3A5N3_9PEZI|nr:hypothetical protein BD289DRAFT_287448 [Coniella lustricola]
MGWIGSRGEWPQSSVTSHPHPALTKQLEQWLQATGSNLTDCYVARRDRPPAAGTRNSRHAAFTE